MTETVTNIVIAGVGGQGVVKCSDILAKLVFRAGFDVKKSEIHGMSQRGGSVISEIRFGNKVWSPMVSDNEADFLLVLSLDQTENNRHKLSPNGILLEAEEDLVKLLENTKSVNVALLGGLSNFLSLPDKLWQEVIAESFPAHFLAQNEQAFIIGKKYFKRD